MDKSLHFNSRFINDTADLLQGKLSGRYDPRDPQISEKARTFRAGNCHLCTGVNFHPRKMLPHKTQYAEILHDHPVQPALIKWQQILIQQRRKLFFFQQCIDRHIKLPMMEMAVFDSLYQLILIRIFRICPGSKHPAPDIDRIRACIYCGAKAFKRAGRRK